MVAETKYKSDQYDEALRTLFSCSVHERLKYNALISTDSVGKPELEHTVEDEMYYLRAGIKRYAMSSICALGDTEIDGFDGFPHRGGC